MSVAHHKGPRPMGTVTVAKESALRPKPVQPSKAEKVELRPPPASRSLPASCPLREPEAMAAYKQAVRAGSELSIHSQRFLVARSPKEMGEWLSRLMEISRDVFQ